MLTGWFQFGAAQKVEVTRPSQSLKRIPTDSFGPEDNRPSIRWCPKLTTKGAKEHEGNPLRIRPLCNFVSFVVHEIRTLPSICSCLCRSLP